jgi:hypothetical protein
MASIHADIEGLTALAASCRHHAFAMRAGGNAPAVGSAFQATSAAVADVHTNAYVAEARFAERLAATGNTVWAVAHGFAGTDADWASKLASITDMV